MRRNKAIKEFDKIRKVIGKNVESIRSLIDSSDELINIISQLKSTKKIPKELTEIHANIVDSIKELTTNNIKLYDSYDLLGVLLFNHPYFP